MADEDFVNVTFRASGYGRFTATPNLGEYDPGDLVEIDREIRHMPLVLERIQKKANEMVDSIEKSEHFHVIMSTGGESRARAYVAPKDNAGIHLEMADSVLLKAAAGMQGK